VPTRPSSDGQYTNSVAFVGDLAAPTPQTQVWDSSAQTLRDNVHSIITSDAATANPSLAFSDDGASLVVRVGMSLQAVPLGGGDGAAQHFEAPPEVGSTFQSGSFAERPPLAAIRMRQPDMWRFAWPMKNGAIVVVQSETGADGKLSTWQTWPDRPRTEQDQLASNDALLGGLEAGGRTRLTFSADGRFLILHKRQGRDRVQQVRVWDLSAEWANAIKALTSDAELIRLACAAARIEQQDGARFSPSESITWFGGEAPQPCP
jgi:hypothetical protein